jgi:hypothetical protein
LEESGSPLGGFYDAPQNSFMDLTVSPKGEQQKDKELGHIP